MTSATADKRTRFQALHSNGFFVIANAWDIGSAMRFENLGFKAIATTSSGHAESIGLQDQEVNFEQLCAHVADLVRAVDIPLSVDSEQLFGSTSEEVAANARVLAELGAAGLSVEDYDPVAKVIEPLDIAVARVSAAAEVARSTGMVLTARAENFLYDREDLDDTISRLQAYEEAGADVLYAPGLTQPDDIARVLAEVSKPVNVLLMATGPAPKELAELGVRRASTGGRLAFDAYEAADASARKLLN